MSGQDRKDFDDRLAELNNWQIEQQKKLKAFQEAQRKLLDSEHQNVLTALNTHNFRQRHNRCSESNSDNVCEKDEIESNLNLHNFKNKDTDGIFHLKFPQIRLSEPKISLFSAPNNSSSINRNDNFFNESVENLENKVTNTSKKFLRRGEGLARFRMTLDDFKGPPKIYKEKKIKTYLNSKPESVASSRSFKSLKSNVKCNKNFVPKIKAKFAPLPVKIYMPEKKPKPCNTGKSAEGKQIPHINKKLNQFFPKSPIENLVLKPWNTNTECYNPIKEKEKAVSEKMNEKNNFISEFDIENKKDEKELRIFEILEKKVDDTSFCSTSSFVDKLMEQSISSTPSKCFAKSKEMGFSYEQGLKSLRSQFLDDDQIKKFEKLNEIPLEDPACNGLESENGHHSGNSPVRVMMGDKESENKHICNEPEAEQPPEVLQKKENEEELQPHKVNKTLLQEYIKDFKKFKFMLEKNAHNVEEEPEKEISPKELLKEDNQEHPNQHDIALKLQRKGLQDNVKQLLNWECPSRKRQPKRVVKKIKVRPKPEKSKSVSKEQSEKVVFTSSLLYERLNELEKEIEIFRKENKNLERLQKECNEERMKLSKEKKEFQKQMQEEREQLEEKIADEQKKLQKEKSVFEKYCKQVKNQPTRQEREEISKLKKEIEKLTETIATKEARWGASQARLRNQIKNLEKENGQLKAEVEKQRKLSSKKVSFESERNLNTKIIHAINSELGKLKPTIVRNTDGGKYQSLSARIDRDPEEKPLRRIKSALNVKKQIEIDSCADACSEFDEKALGSVSTDSGIETNYVHGQKVLHDSKIALEATVKEPERANCCSPLFKPFGEDATGRNPESTIESVVRDAIFGDTEMNTKSIKIAEMKNRLERLNLLGCVEERSENHPARMVALPGNLRRSESEEESESFVEEQEEDSGKNLEEDISLKKSILNKNDSFSSFYARKNLVESRPGENGIWEKIYEDGSKEINYPNGNVKKIFPGSKIVRMTYYNGDIKETNVAEGSEKYYYAETKTWHTTYKDGLDVLEFPNGQTERRHADGSTEISFPNGCVRYCDYSGRDEWRFLDGTVIKTNQCGHKILLMPNGQKEIHTKEFKRREYPDGTVKILYSDGTQETRYASGRVRLKDKDGNLVMDSGGIS